MLSLDAADARERELVEAQEQRGLRVEEVREDPHVVGLVVGLVREGRAEPAARSTGFRDRAFRSRTRNTVSSFHSPIWA